MNDDNGYFRGLVTGVLVGAAAALLLTPKRGGELREGIAEGAHNLKDRASDAVETAQIAAFVKADELRDAVLHRGANDGADNDQATDEDALDGVLDVAADAAEEIEATQKNA